jgi:hypothetical protein
VAIDPQPFLTAFLAALSAVFLSRLSERILSAIEKKLLEAYRKIKGKLWVRS